MDDCWYHQKTDGDDQNWLCDEFNDHFPHLNFDLPEEPNTNDASNNLNLLGDSCILASFDPSANLNASTYPNGSTDFNALSNLNASTNLNASAGFYPSTNLNASIVMNSSLPMPSNQGGASKQDQAATETEKVKKPRQSERDKIPKERREEAKRLLFECSNGDVPLDKLNHSDLLIIFKVLISLYNSTVASPLQYLSLTRKAKRSLVYLHQWFLENVDKIKSYLDVLTIECIEPQKVTRKKK